jgi:hypothetical protein
MEVWLHALLTWALEVRGQLHAPAALPPGNIYRNPLYRNLSGPHKLSGRGDKEKVPAPAENRTPVFQLVA